jgi:hypothetical protein
MALKEIGWEGIDWIKLAQDSWGNISFLRRTLLHVVSQSVS